VPKLRAPTREFYLDRLPQRFSTATRNGFTRILGGDLPFTDTTYNLEKLAGGVLLSRTAQHR
jgi:hypothetical protein